MRPAMLPVNWRGARLCLNHLLPAVIYKIHFLNVVIICASCRGKAGFRHTW